MDFETQERYFTELKDRYTEVYSAHFVKNGLDDDFASLSLDGKSVQRPNAGKATLTQQPNSVSNRISTILMAMRKLREAIVASARIDAFTLHTYTFIIRATVLLKHMESYHPALLYLLHRIHPVVPLSKSEYNEFLGYYVLDLACRQDALAAAYQVKIDLGYRDAVIEAVLKTLIHGNWCLFWRFQNVVTMHQKSLMGWAENRIRNHTLDCFGKSYLSLTRQYLEKSVRCPWYSIKRKDGLNWQVEGDIVTIRRINKK